METPATVWDALRQGDWVTSIDLSDTYFHILIHHLDMKWLRFRWGDKVYQFRALPFGLSLAPWIFTMVVRQLCSLIRQRGVCLRAYLDDWLIILHQSRDLCLSHTHIVLGLAMGLGFAINQAKSDLCPAQVFTYLGMRFDTVSFFIYLVFNVVFNHEGYIATIRHSGMDSSAFSQESVKTSGIDSCAERPAKSAGEASCVSFGTDGIHGQACSFGKSPQAPVPSSAPSGMAACLSRMADVSADSGVVPSHNQSVAADGLDHAGRSYRPSTLQCRWIGSRRAFLSSFHPPVQIFAQMRPFRDGVLTWDSTRLRASVF
ncbi:hypothetical protein V1264_016700 [Littorina saxatilis]|uniref:Reverse transcriptase domain-containing protein n=1 Tax=Littorina saxatilis TaxID=31220 RepID=A0AAN9BHH3_9CAEN